MKYFAGVLGVLVLLFVVFLLILGRGNDSSAPQGTAVVRPAQLADYASQNSVVSVTTVGRLVGDEQHREVRISVSQNERRLEVLSGYNQQVIQSQTYANTRAAYETFLSAIGARGFLSSKKSDLDPRSVCPTGNRYVYDLSVNGEHTSNLWITSCSKKTGTFNGNSATIRQIFQQQIPDYNKQLQNVNL